MINIAILGFGVVGSGVYTVLSRCKKGVLKDVAIKYILDLRRFPGHPMEKRVTDDFDSIIADESVKIVIETMGGVDPAYKFSLAALNAGKSVITSNKAVVDKHGRELEQAAVDNGVHYFYEASVGGGIPVISPLRECFEPDSITRIAGILNGTTNHILTHMYADGKTLEEALDTARALGYAEADPHNDLAGLDTARKIAILAGIAFGRYIPFESIPVIEGIEDITLEDLRLADGLGCRIKLIAVAEQVGDHANICVAPFLVGWDSLFHAVNDVQNAISVTGSSTGEVVFYGHGAGGLPTASAVCGDIARVIKGAPQYALRRECKPGFVLPEGGDFKRVTLANGKVYRVM